MCRPRLKRGGLASCHRNGDAAPTSESALRVAEAIGIMQQPGGKQLRLLFHSGVGMYALFVTIAKTLFKRLVDWVTTT